jgi:hypothetical protein
LESRGVPTGQIDRVLDFTHGHALALSLVADFFDQQPEATFQPEAAPDIVKTLLEEFVQGAPSPTHRAALEACALVRLMTESLLATMLRQADAHELFAAARPVVHRGRPARHLPPRLAREALGCRPEVARPRRLRRATPAPGGYYMQRVQHGAGPDQRRLLAAYIYLHRDNPSVRPFFLWQESGTVFTDGLRPNDVEELPEMVARHEGSESAALAAHWLARQPDGFRVLREASGEPVGFLNCVRLEATTPTDRETDPALSAVWPLLAHNPLRGGETASYFRFWMARETYQSVSPEHTRLVLNMMQHYLVTPGLAVVQVLADPVLVIGVQ